MNKIKILEATKKALSDANIPEEKRMSSLYIAAWIQDNAERLEMVDAQIYKITGPSTAITCTMPDVIFDDCNTDSFFSLIPLCDGIRFAKESWRGEYLQICFRVVF